VCRIECADDSAQLSREIIEQISTSRLVIADLTGERPNCYYEAGFAHALGKPVIFCIRGGDPVHFDLAAYEFIVWETEADLRRQIKARLAVFLDRTARLSA
jgi:nucleoside 2-deoxyribosyltransferase